MASRRTFILGAAGIGGALVVGWALLPPRQRLQGAQPLPLTAGEHGFNGWVKITGDDRVIVQVPKSEMGQGVLTSLAMLVADELDADWARVSVEHPPLDAIYNNIATVVDGLPFHPDDHGAIKRSVEWLAAKAMREVGVQMTGGSSSVKDLWLPMREAGAAARAMLVAAAAAKWRVPVPECRVEAGRVLHAAGHSARFGELAADAAREPVPQAPKLKAPAEFKLIGRTTRRIDSSDKARGAARFGIDVVLPGMVYASVRHCPTLGGRVASFDARPAQGLPGVIKVLAFEGRHGGTGGIAAIADTPWHAMKAVAAVQVEWDHGPAALFDGAEAIDRLGQLLDQDDGFGYRSSGDVDAALKAAAKTIRAEYRAPWLAHQALEPINCTVQFKDGRAGVWASTQVPGLARMVAAQALGIASDAVDVKVQLLGGGFGRRLEVDFVAEAATIASQAAGAPVQVIWSREEDTRNDIYRPACVARFAAGFDARGTLTAWHNVSAGQSIVHAVLGRLFGLPGVGPDKTTAEGAYDQPYEFPNSRIGHATVELPVPPGFWRSVGHSHHAFFKEGFIDECAAAVGADPVAFRAGLLNRHPRHLKVLQAAAQAAGWGTPLAPAADGAKKARGVALHQSFGSIVAQVAEVSVGADKKIRVHKVWCAIDCGTPVNPAGIRQQMESGVVFGLSAALYGQITVVRGQVQQGNFHDAQILRLPDAPVVETVIVDRSAHPEGVGEPGTPPIAPAVAGAVFALTGQRLRQLPLTLS